MTLGVLGGGGEEGGRKSTMARFAWRAAERGAQLCIRYKD